MKKKRRVVQQPLQPLTLFGMAGSLTNISLIWSDGGKEDMENSRESSMLHFFPSNDFNKNKNGSNNSQQGRNM